MNRIINIKGNKISIRLSIINFQRIVVIYNVFIYRINSWVFYKLRLDFDIMLIDGKKNKYKVGYKEII